MKINDKSLQSKINNIHYLQYQQIPTKKLMILMPNYLANQHATPAKNIGKLNEKHSYMANHMNQKLTFNFGINTMNPYNYFGMNSKSSSYVHSQTCRVPFSHEEDEKLKELTKKFGIKDWSLISSYMTGRTSKQCRDRYANYLTPGYFKGQWSNEEDELIIKLYKEHGPKWSIIKK